MKVTMRVQALILLLAGAFVFSGCDLSGGGGDTVAAPAAEGSGFGSATSPGDSGVLTLTETSETLTMIYAQNQASISFPTGTDDGTPATLTTRFWMAETEVTNTVVAAVFQWAYDNGRFSSNVNDPNGLDTTTAKHGGQELINLGSSDCRINYDSSGTFTAETGYEDNPLTNVTWYGAVMLCNWLTEMRDGNDGNVVYEWVDNGDGEGTASDGIWQDDETDENRALNGYRLPSTDEWEYAARYLGTTAPSTGGNLDTERKYGNDNPSWTNGYYWTPGNYASGATADYNDASACQAVAVYDYTDPDPYSDEQQVNSLGAGSANELGLYDMIGNVWEWCFTEDGSNRVTRGGSWYSHANGLQVGRLDFGPGNVSTDDLGFRLCRTAD